MLSPFYTHRHPDFWTDPDRFDPDRWTRDAETTTAGRDRNAVIRCFVGGAARVVTR
jgi:cytochrome P450